MIEFNGSLQLTICKNNINGHVVAIVFVVIATYLLTHVSFYIANDLQQSQSNRLASIWASISKRVVYKF